MLQVTITSLDGKKQWQGQFNSQGEIDSWISSQESVQSWGKPERTILADADGDISGEDVSKATSEQDITHTDQTTGNTEIRKQYTFPADYSISDPVDITAQITQAQAVQKAQGAIQFGQQVIATVWAANTANKVSVDQMKTMIADPVMNQIFVALGTGSINTAHDLIKGLGTTYFTQAQIDGIVSMIEASPYYEAPTTTTTT